MQRTCLDCPAPISRCSKGRCRACSIARLNADPAIAERRAAARDAHFATLGVRGEYRARVKAANRAWRTSPEGARQLREQALSIRQRGVEASRSAEARAKRGASGSATKLRDIPLEYRDEHRHNVRSKRMKAADSRALIRAKIADAAKRRASFAGQMERLSRGEGRAVAKIVAPA